MLGHETQNHEEFWLLPRVCHRPGCTVAVTARHQTGCAMSRLNMCFSILSCEVARVGVRMPRLMCRMPSETWCRTSSLSSS